MFKIFKSPNLKAFYCKNENLRELIKFRVDTQKFPFLYINCKKSLVKSSTIPMIEQKNIH